MLRSQQPFLVQVPGESGLLIALSSLPAGPAPSLTPFSNLIRPPIFSEISTVGHWVQRLNPRPENLILKP